jgi:non-ribosomal peptide synthetase component F
VEQPVIRHFHAVVDRFADKIAIDDGTTRLTYREVSAAVDELAARVVGATPGGGPVLASLENTAAFPVVFLACLIAGRPVIPVDPGYPKAQREAIGRECGAAAVIVGDGLPWPEGVPASLPRVAAPRFPAPRTSTSRSSAGLGDAVDRDEATVPDVATPGSEAGLDSMAGIAGAPGIVGASATVNAPTNDSMARIAGAPGIDGTAGVIYTSGSTGRPKGVAFSHRHLLASVAEYVNACHIGHRDRLLALASLSGASGREALAALLTGATLTISDLRQTGIGGAFRALINGRITVVAFVPSVLAGFAARPDAAEAMGSLRIVDLFGEKTTPDTVAALRAVLPRSCHIRVSLGSTETMTLFHWFVPRDFAGAVLPCGYLAENKSIMVVDDAGAPVRPGAVGEVVVRGRYVASGMWRDGAVLPGPFAPDADDPGSRIFHTGDLIRLRPDGLAEFAGRSDRRVKIHGLWADPADVEAVLHRLPGIAECAVVTRADTILLAYVVPDRASANGSGPNGRGTNGTRPISLRQLRAALRAELPPHLMPAHIHLIERIPRLPNFKPDLVALARGDTGGVALARDDVAAASV